MSLNPKILVLYLCNANTSVEANAWKQHKSGAYLLGKVPVFLKYNLETKL